MAKPGKLPLMVVVDDDEQVLRAVVRDLRSQYRAEYRIEYSTSAAELLEAMPQWLNEGETVALLLSDQRMPEMQGVDFLEKARKLWPDARKVLLTAYSDTDAAIRAINTVQLDYYLVKPWDPPEEKLYPIISEQLYLWKLQHVPRFRGLRLLGYQFSPITHAYKDFLAGNLFPYQWLDAQANADAAQLIALNQLEPAHLPAVVLEDGTVLRRPSLSELGAHLGLGSTAPTGLYDVAIIGAGPAGLAAAVYGASEGLRTVLIEKRAPGGQAGTSSRIENYLGFPAGLSGAELSRRAIDQVRKFNAEFLAPAQVESIAVQDGYKLLNMSDGSQLRSRAVVITAGVTYRELAVPGLQQFTGAGVYYGAATTEAQAAQGGQVYIVGGGNSAGQGAVYLSKYAAQVHIVVRKPDLSSSMSSYLIDQINALPNISLIGCCELQEAMGSDRLQQIALRNTTTGAVSNHPADLLFIFIGAKPAAEWTGEQVLKDSKGFIETGRALMAHPNYALQWKQQREPLLLETSVPGIFAAGDVRSGAMNRVASAVGEGSMAIKFVHEYLAMV